MAWLNNVPLTPLVLAAILLGLAPFDEPHLWQRLKAIATGEALSALNNFDLLMHCGLPALLGMKLLYVRVCPPSYRE